MKDELSSSVLCNLPRPPDEPRLEIAWNGRERWKKKEERKEKLIWDNFRDLGAPACDRPILPSPLRSDTGALLSGFTKPLKRFRLGRINNRILLFSCVPDESEQKRHVKRATAERRG